MTGERAIRGVLFDVDGTLIDSGYQHASAWWQAFRRQDVDVPISTIHRAIGMGGDKLIPHVIREAALAPDSIDAEAADSAQAAIFSTHWPELRRLPGARELVKRAKSAGLTTVLASSAGSAELTVLRKVLGADDWLDHVTDADDAEESKPAPDLVRAALEQAQLRPGRAVFVGDSVWDVQAAHAAGVKCIGVECGGTSAAELREAGAEETYRDPGQLVERWDASLIVRGG